MQQTQSKASKKSRQVTIGFSEKPITSWGGTAAIISRFVEKIGFKAVIEKCIPFEETSNNTTGVYAKIVALFISILNGGYRFSHINVTDGSSKIFERCFDVTRLPQASTSLTRFLSRFNSQYLNNVLRQNIATLLLSVLFKSANLTSDSLRFDSTVITRYGEQEGARRGYNPSKKGRPSHQPQIAFLGSGYTVNFWNRSGNTSSGNGIVDFFSETISYLPEIKIDRVLADSGYYTVDFIKTLEDNNYEYIIAAPILRVMQKQIQSLKDWTTVAPGIEVTDFMYEHSATHWKKPRRYVVIRQEIAVRPKATGKQMSLFSETYDCTRYRHSLLITNNETESAYAVWDYYKPRANDENVIENMKDGFGLSAFSMKSFWATEAVMMIICLIFHNLITYLIKYVLRSEKQTQKLRTLRMEYLVIPATLGKDGRNDVLRMGIRPGKRRNKLLDVFEKLKLLALNFNCNAVGFSQC
jgi:hypothetical protein